MRPGAVDLGGDALSHDVFTQAAQAVRTNPQLPGGRAPAVVLGTAHADRYGLDRYDAANARDRSIDDGAPTAPRPHRCRDPRTVHKGLQPARPSPGPLEPVPPPPRADKPAPARVWCQKQ